jgi:hypothetical protein
MLASLRQQPHSGVVADSASTWTREQCFQIHAESYQGEVMKVSDMKVSEVLVLLALLISVAGLILYAIHPSNKPPDFGLAVIAVGGTFSLGAIGWAISEK